MVEKNIDAELDKIIKIGNHLKRICNNLEKYEERVKWHNTAIIELQDLIVDDRVTIKELKAKLDKLEKKYGKDVMYQ